MKKLLLILVLAIIEYPKHPAPLCVGAQCIGESR